LDGPAALRQADGITCIRHHGLRTSQLLAAAQARCLSNQSNQPHKYNATSSYFNDH
jgi:hypothetical protein